jgi:5-methyltetrahydrofolate--homocysteine methyltransferase
LYEERKLYLSQLISASETMEVAMEILQPFFGAGVPEKGTILLATVEGDMHDIGKNLVGMVLKSYGYRVVDMGKNVSREKIIERCKCGDVVAVGLSSLMTTTIPSLRETIRALKKEFPSMPVVVGGATLSEELAKELGADAYAPDAASAPEAFERVISKGVEKRI